MKNLLVIALLFLCTQAFCQGQFQKETSGSIAHFSGQIMQLAQAIPAEKFSWSPQPGVRSVAQVCAHVVSANYWFATKLGGKIPDGVKMESLEMDLKTKDAILAELKRSSETIASAIKNVPDAALTTKVEFPFPGEYTGMSAALIALSHVNEHLGQLIAYARTNGVTPPWSQASK